MVFSVGGGNLGKNVSPNLVSALQYAKEVGSSILGIVGRDGGYTAKVADACCIVPTVNPQNVTPHSEAFQAVIWHLLVSHPKLKIQQTTGFPMKSVEIVRLRGEHEDLLCALLSRISEDDAIHFHPHPFDQVSARSICSYTGNDQYYGVFHQGVLVGYGMLGGWDEGFAIPSLGIYLLSESRGTGLAQLLMQHLHSVAKLYGAEKVMLKVNRDNLPARRLYERIGYKLKPFDERQLVGYIDL
jgi:ribosomal protein S18 acetylase RimI-like enzyme